jgi:hypothetical protein
MTREQLLYIIVIAVDHHYRDYCLCERCTTAVSNSKRVLERLESAGLRVCTMEADGSYKPIEEAK